ncbi:MAG TPA: hypothetical protein VET90_09405 [Candidatus Binatus sp.]|nr:hypothetical protein [Candidatus Binatus sp.]
MPTPRTELSVPRMPLLIRTFPSIDATFCREVERRARLLTPGSPIAMVAALRACLDDLREAHPHLEVRVADRLATFRTDEVIVYVFRDGTTPGERHQSRSDERPSDLQAHVPAGEALLARNAVLLGRAGRARRAGGRGSRAEPPNSRSGPAARATVSEPDDRPRA